LLKVHGLLLPGDALGNTIIDARKQTFAILGELGVDRVRQMLRNLENGSIGANAVVVENGTVIRDQKALTPP
jgi:hypothetical protein